MKPPALLIVAACGAMCGFGLAYATLIQPEAVIGFLRGNDSGPALALGAALAVAAAAWRLAPNRMQRPLSAQAFDAPTAPSRKALVGAAIFGAGCGLCGAGAAAAIAALGAGNWPLLWVLAGFAIGAWLHDRCLRRSQAR